MPNIRQQKKRVRSAARQRVENLRWRSTAKTLMRRLESAAEGGDAEAVGKEHTELVRWLDRAAARGSIHKNTAARRKAQAQPRRLAAAQPLPSALGRAAPRYIDERALELEIRRQPRAALRRSVELRQPNERVAELLGREVRTPARTPSRRRTGCIFSRAAGVAWANAVVRQLLTAAATRPT